MVWQAASAVKIPLIGIGGIATAEDAVEFLIAGATAVQIGTANFYNPTVSMQIVDALPKALAELGASSVEEVVGTIEGGRRKAKGGKCEINNPLSPLPLSHS
jgi:dihydroorotate dehydrogenase (NAD+) catalytic subunit